MEKIEELEAKIEDLRAQLHFVSRGDEMKLKAAGFRLGSMRIYEDVAGILRSSGKITCHYGTAAERAASSDYQEGVFWWESDNDELFVGTGAGWQDVGGASVGGAHNFLSATSHVDTATQGATRGSLVVGNSTPKWDELTKGSSGNVLRMADANDPGWSAPGISDTNILRVDGSPSDDEYAKFTSDGLEGRTYANVRTDINVADGADVTGDNAPKAHGPAQHTEGNAWKLLYLDAAGDETEIAVGADGTVLTGTGVASAPAFQAASEHAHANDHAESHNVASHNDTTITGAETETLSDGSDADSLHIHPSKATKELDNLASVAINTSLISDADSTDDLGSSAKYWANVYADKLYLNATATLDGATAGRVALTGDLDVSGHIAAGSAATPDPERIINADAELTDHPCSAAYLRAIGTKASGAQVTIGVTGGAIQRGTPSAGFAYGLYYSAIQGSASAMAVLAGIYLSMGSEAGGSGAISAAFGIQLATPTWTGAAPVTTKGFYIQDQGDAATTNVYGIQVTDQTATTITRLLEMGPATPYLRLVGGANPAANETNMYIKEEATLRHVQWKAGDALGAGDKVMILV